MLTTSSRRPPLFSLLWLVTSLCFIHWDGINHNNNNNVNINDSSPRSGATSTIIIFAHAQALQAIPVRKTAKGKVRRNKNLLPQAKASAIPLTNGQELTGQSGSPNTATDYVLKGVPKGSTATCYSYGGTGVLQMSINFDNPSQESIAIRNACQSIAPNSTFQVCTTPVVLADSGSDAYMTLWTLATGFSGVSVLCLASPAKTFMMNTDMLHLQGKKDDYTVYALGGITWGDEVVCTMRPDEGGNPSKGDVNFYMAFNTIPNPWIGLWDCVSADKGNEQYCDAFFFFEGYEQFSALDVGLFVGIEGVTDYSGLTLRCNVDRDPVIINSGDKFVDISSYRGGIWTYALQGVNTGKKVSCYTSGNNGDADLYVSFTLKPIANWYATWFNDCESYSSTSNEACTTPGAPFNTTAYVSIRAAKPYAGLEMGCTVA